MAKQTFTTGQVLTAAQMTSLQQTAMLGGNAAVKTTSYVLVAADAGTSVAMNSTSATTVTVNTGLFAAGDTVTIINQNTGVCTITAGTATVRKASGASLALSQYQGGVLDFVSASEAIFFPFDVGGATNPLTTKGDLWTYSTTDARLGVGTNGQVLSANSSTATGLEWTTISAGGETLISTTTFSGSAVDLTSIPGTYNHLRLEITGLTSASTGCRLFVRINNDTGSVYNWSNASLDDGAANNLYTEADSRFDYIGWAGNTGSSDDDKGYIIINFWDYTNTSRRKFVTSRAYARLANVLKHADFTGLYFGSDNAITTINLTGACGATTLTSGTAKLYGIK